MTSFDMCEPVSSSALTCPQVLQRYDPQRGSFYQFWMGIRFFGAGWGLFWQSQRLKLISLIPIVITILVFGGLTALSVFLTEQLLEGLPPDWPAWILRLIDGLGVVLSLVILLALSYVLFSPVASVISSPFREALATHIETSVYGRASDVSVGSWLVILGDIIQSVSFQLLIIVLTAVVGWFVPVIGPFITVATLIFLAGLDMVDPALSVQGYLLKQKLGFIRSHPALMMGFSGISFLVLGLPVLNIVMLPIASVGGSLLVLGVLRPMTQTLRDNNPLVNDVREEQEDTVES